MTRTTKIVRFYEPVLLDQQDQRQAISATFWGDLHQRLTALTVAQRQHPHSGATYFGEGRTSVTPATNYVYVGRLRDPADNPDAFTPTAGITGPLLAPGRGGRFSEPTYLLPFGLKNQVAVMNPVIGGTHSRALDTWITAMCGLTTSGNRVELAPIVDSSVLQKLQEAQGATRLYVRVPPDAQIPATGGGVVGDAIREAAERRVPDAYLDLTWSFGHLRPTDQRRAPLLTAARWLGAARWTDKVEVSLHVPEGDTFRVEAHDLFRDRITLTGSFDVAAGSTPSERAVLTAMFEAVEEYRRRI